MNEQTRPKTSWELRAEHAEAALTEALKGWEQASRRLHDTYHGVFATNRPSWEICSNAGCAADRAAIARLRGEP